MVDPLGGDQPGVGVLEGAVDDSADAPFLPQVVLVVDPDGEAPLAEALGGFGEVQGDVVLVLLVALLGVLGRGVGPLLRRDSAVRVSE